MIKVKIIRLLPLIILLVATVVLLISILTNTVLLMQEHIVGLVLLSIAVTSQILNERIGYQVTGGLLLIGTFAFAAFTPTIYTFYFRAGALKVSFDYLCLVTLLIYIFVHRNELPKWFASLIK